MSLPLSKLFKDYSVSFSSMKLQKFRYCPIELPCHFRSSALLTHGRPGGLKRSKSAFLLVGHKSFMRQATADPKKKAAPPQEPQSHVVQTKLKFNLCFGSVVPYVPRDYYDWTGDRNCLQGH